MSFLPVFLWTDILIFLLLALILFGILYTVKRPHLISPWKAVFKRKRGVIAFIILLSYFSIGLLDSFHFRYAIESDNISQEQHYSVEVRSILDVLTTGLTASPEKTYSAPFATRLFVKEMITDEQGHIHFETPRLEAGKHLKSESDKHTDIKMRILDNTIKAILVTLVFAVVVVVIVRYYTNNATLSIKCIITGKATYPVLTAVLSILVITVIGWNMMVLSHYYHVFGTDKVGQDVLYQTIKSIRTGLIIGTLTTLVMLPFALFMGIAAGYFKGWIDDVIQYIYTTLNSIPSVLLIAAAVLMLQVYIGNHPEYFQTVAERADIRLVFLCIILGLTSWTSLCRILRAETLKLREADYVLAAQSMGVRGLTILHRHILPNLVHIIMITIVLDFSSLVLAEAVLSYVGVGVDPSMHSWGNMINGARLEMSREPIVWWSLAAAFVAMFMLVLAANLFADAVRDAFDPRLQSER
jgi:peptide/nickel transport system permease protein